MTVTRDPRLRDGPLVPLPEEPRVLRARQAAAWVVGSCCAALAALGLRLVIDDRSFGTDFDRPGLLLAGGLIGVVTSALALRMRAKRSIVLDGSGLTADDGVTPWSAVEAVTIRHGLRRSVLVVDRGGAPPVELPVSRLGLSPTRARNLLWGWRCAALGVPYVRAGEPCWEGPRSVRMIGGALVATAVAAAATAPLGTGGILMLAVAVVSLGFLVALPPGLRHIRTANGSPASETDELLGQVRVPAAPGFAGFLLVMLAGTGCLVAAATAAEALQPRQAGVDDPRAERLLEDRLGVEVDLTCGSLRGELVCTGTRESTRYRVTVPDAFSDCLARGRHHSACPRLAWSDAIVSKD